MNKKSYKKIISLVMIILILVLLFLSLFFTFAKVIAIRFYIDSTFLLYVPICVFLLMLISSFATYLAEHFFDIKIEQSELKVHFKDINIFLIFVIIVFVALYEEFLFRYFFIEIFSVANLLWIGVFVQAVIFGFLHFYNVDNLKQSVVVLIVTFIVGIVLGIFYVYLGYLFVVITHFLYDFIGIVVSKYVLKW